MPIFKKVRKKERRRESEIEGGGEREKERGH